MRFMQTLFHKTSKHKQNYKKVVTTKIKKKYILNRDKNNLSFERLLKQSFRYTMAVYS